MAIEDLEQEINKALSSVKESRNATNGFNKLVNELSRDGVEKLIKSVKNQLKISSLLTDQQLDAIKTSKDAAAVMGTLEDKLFIAKGAEKLLIMELIENLKKLNIEHENAIGIANRLSKAHEDLIENVSSSVAKFFSLDQGLKLMSKALKDGYTQMVRLTNKGMLGAIGTLQTMSIKLMLLPEELEDIINKNRDLVEAFGGGVKGIEAFGASIEEARSGLEYLGKDSTKAAAKFIETLKGAGITHADAGYAKTMEKVKKSYTNVAAMFGDTYEEFADTIGQQINTEQTRTRMLGQSKNKIVEEIAARTENLKVLGLSNKEIVDFNSKIEDLTNPMKGGQAEKTKGGLMLQASTQTAIGLLRSGGTVEGQKVADRLEKSAPAAKKISDMINNNQTDKLKAYLSTGEGAEFAKAYAEATGTMQQEGVVKGGTRFGMNLYQQQVEQGGAAVNTVLGYGKEVRGGEQRGLKPLTDAEIATQVKDLINQTGAITTAFEKLSNTLGTFNSVKNNPIAEFATSILEVAGAIFFSAKGIKTVVGLLLGGGRVAAVGGGLAEGAMGLAGVAGIAGLAVPAGILVGGAALATAGYYGSKAISDSMSFGSGNSGSIATSDSIPTGGSAQRPAVMGGSKAGATAGSNPYSSLISQVEQANGIPTGMLSRLIKQESGFNPNAISPKGAQGIAQFTPATAKDLGINPMDPNQAIPAAGRYLKQMYSSTGNWNSALAAYNWGIGNVKKHPNIANMPLETRKYVAAIGGGDVGSVTTGGSTVSAAQASNSTGSAGPSSTDVITNAESAMINLLAQIANNTRHSISKPATQRTMSDAHKAQATGMA